MEREKIMANYENFKRGDCGLFSHCERKKDEHGNYVTFGNQRIDSTRTHLNYNLCPDTREQTEILASRLADPNLKCQNRADVNVFGSWCITLPTQAPIINENGEIEYEEKRYIIKMVQLPRRQFPNLKMYFITKNRRRNTSVFVMIFLRNGTEKKM